jgi:ketosteroid isomerase-like protein
MEIDGHEHPDALAYRRTADAFRARDMDTLAQLFVEDVVWHVPGMSALAGDIHGRDELWQWFDRLHEVTGGTFTLEDHDILATEDHVVAPGTWRSVARDGPDSAGPSLHIRLMGRSWAGSDTIGAGSRHGMARGYACRGYPSRPGARSAEPSGRRTQGRG